MQIERVLLKRSEVCERAGITPTRLRDLRTQGLIPGPVVWRRFGGRGSEAFYDPSLVERIRRVEEMRKRRWGVDRIRLELGAKIRLTDAQFEALEKVRVPIPANPGVGEALAEANRRVREILGPEIPSGFLYSLRKEGEDVYLVVAGVGR